MLVVGICVRPNFSLRGVIFPTYGLAEHTVYVCSNGRDRLVIDRIMFETEWKVRWVALAFLPSN